MKATTNNIFKYATKELSLEAILRWDLEWIHYPNHDLYEMAEKILEKFGLPQGSYQPGELDIYQQQYNIDILLILKDINQAIIIELKTFTFEHGDQIKRYRDKLISLSNWELNKLGLKQELTESDIKTVYFKTGFWFDCDQCVKTDYKVDGREFLNILEKYSSKSEILKDYCEYLTCNIKDYEKTESFLDKWDNGNWKISWDHVRQYKFMRSIFSMERWKEKKSEFNRFAVYHGSSSGRPWTQLKVLQIEDGDRYNVFWRIDTYVSGPCIALRYYDAYDKKSDSEKKAHVDTYSRLRSLIGYIINNDKKITLSWDEVRGSRYTGNYTETTLMIISLNDYLEDEKKLNELFNNIERLTDELIRKIQSK